MLFGMLEEVAHEVTRSQQNVHLLQHLLQELRKRLEDYLWGNKLGSTILWEQHSRRLRNINAIATTIQIREVGVWGSVWHFLFLMICRSDISRLLFNLRMSLSFFLCKI